MNRLDFLKVIFAALVLKKLPFTSEKLLLPRTHLKTFSVGFTVTDEMLKDDIYAHGKGIAEQLAIVQRQHTNALAMAFA